ncbi:MAG: hypothetical protein ABI210_14205 [Abditibacteriaceae bacterium]
MHNAKKKDQWKKLVVGALAAACIAVPFTTTSHADSMKTTSDSSMAMSENPMQVSGTVEKYYTDRSGLVTAMDLSTSTMGVQKVRFAPSWANRLWNENPVGSKLDGWVVKSDNGMCNLVSIGADRPNRFLTNDFHTGTERLLSTAWIWKDSATETVTGQLNQVIVSEKGEVLALELKDGTLIRVPTTVKNQEQGAHGTEQVAQLFKGAEVTAWGPQVWNARGDVSIYGKRIAATGLSINGKTVSAIGIQNLDANTPLLGTIFNQTSGLNGEFSPFDASMQKQAPAPTMKDMNK